MRPAKDRRDEWFVPTFGPVRFRVFVGLLFLPYTGMVLSFVVIGSVLAEAFDLGRMLGLVGIYFLALGIAGHALDAFGSRAVKPWGKHFSARQLWAMIALSLLPATVVGVYYSVRFAPLLWPIGLLEYFFLFAYNLEWFNGRFHTPGWFMLSWGMLPVLAGYVSQTNEITPAVLVVALAAGLFSLVEISASRPYRKLKRASNPGPEEDKCARHYEGILKWISLGVMALGLGLLIWRLTPASWP